MYHTRTVLKFKINYFFYSFTFFLKKIQQLCIIYPNAHALFSDSLSDSAKSLYVSTFFSIFQISQNSSKARAEILKIFYIIFFYFFFAQIYNFINTRAISNTHTHTHNILFFFFIYTTTSYLYIHIHNYFTFQCQKVHFAFAANVTFSYQTKPSYQI